MRRLFYRFLISVPFFPIVAIAQNAKVDPSLALAGSDSNVQVIVRYRNRPTAAQHAAAVNGGGIVRADLGMLNSGAYTVPASRLQNLSTDPEVESIVPDRPLHSLLDVTTAAVNAPAAWNSGLTGAGIGVAVIDSGISDVDDLQGIAGSRVVYRENFIHAQSSDDYYGHGEHVSGIIAGNGADSTCRICDRTFKGVAPGVRLIDLRVLDSNGNGADSFVIAAIQRAIQLKDTYNIRVINLSLGHAVFESYQTDPLCQAVEKAWKAGIVVVVAAGNDGRDNSFGNNGYGTIGSPGNDPFVITVGAMKSLGTSTRTDDLIASYSSKGPTLIDHIVKPDIVAPGNRVVSLLAPAGTLRTAYPADLVPTSYFEWTSSSALSTHYFTLSGTSMAAPVVSGAAALLLQAHPDLTPDQIKARLMRSSYKTFPQSSVAYEPTTGTSYTSYYDIFTVGAGYLDIQAALADRTVFQGVANSPSVVFTPSKGRQAATTQLVCGPQTICYPGNSSSAGNNTGLLGLLFDLLSPNQSNNNDSSSGQQSVWGNNSVAGSQSVWGNQAVWANKTVLGEQSVWGNQSIWANQSVWGNQSVWANMNASSLNLRNSITLKGEN